MRSKPLFWVRPRELRWPSVSSAPRPQPRWCLGTVRSFWPWRWAPCCAGHSVSCLPSGSSGSWALRLFAPGSTGGRDAGAAGSWAGADGRGGRCCSPWSHSHHRGWETLAVVFVLVGGLIALVGFLLRRVFRLHDGLHHGGGPGRDLADRGAGGDQRISTASFRTRCWP